MYRKTRLANGVRVITHDMPTMQSVAVGVWIYAGGRFENAENKGISHYLEHLLFKGTRKYSLRKLKESIEGVGGSFNGFTSEEATCYLVKLPHRYLDVGLDVLADMVINPLLPALEIEKERSVILEELKMYRDLPQSYVYELLDELLWPAQMLGLSVIGTVESINRIDRERLAGYKETHYSPRNIVVSAAGRLTHTAVVKKAARLFSGLANPHANAFDQVTIENSRPQLHILDKGTEQAHLAMGFHSLHRDHPLKHAQGLMHIILGGNMSSRLFNEVREKKGLAYEIGTQVKRFQDTGAFLVHAGMDNVKVSDTLAVILKEAGKLTRTLVTENEFKRAKEFYLGQLELALEDTMDCMLWIGESTVMLDRVRTLGEVIKEVERVRRPELREVAQEVFKEEKIKCALIGPVKDKEVQIAAALHIG